MIRGTGPGARPKLRPSVLSKLALGAVVVCSFAAFAASGASAACAPPGCYTLSFNHVLLDAGGTPANIVTPSTAPLTADANITGATPGEANYQVEPSGVSFPSYSFSIDGFSGTINTTLASPANGTINLVSGAVTMAADFAADVHLNGVTGDCTLDTGTVSMSTANTQPLMGVPFPAGASGSPPVPNSVTGPGALGGTWSTVTTSPSGAEACTLLTVGGLTNAGGIWISRNLTPPSPTVTHNKLKAVKAGKTEAVKIKVANTGQVGTGLIKLCLKVPKQLKVNKKCQTVANVAAGKTDIVTFKVKTSKKHRPKHSKTYKLTLTPSTTTEGLTGNKSLAAQVIKFTVKH